MHGKCYLPYLPTGNRIISYFLSIHKYIFDCKILQWIISIPTRYGNLFYYKIHIQAICNMRLSWHSLLVDSLLKSVFFNSRDNKIVKLKTSQISGWPNAKWIGFRPAEIDFPPRIVAVVIAMTFRKHTIHVARMDFMTETDGRVAANQRHINAALGTGCHGHVGASFSRSPPALST